MRVNDRSLVNITSLIPSLASINSSSDDLIEFILYVDTYSTCSKNLYWFVSTSNPTPCSESKSRKTFPPKVQDSIGSLTPQRCDLYRR